jgi:hypothetical protein
MSESEAIYNLISKLPEDGPYENLRVRLSQRGDGESLLVEVFGDCKPVRSLVLKPGYGISLDCKGSSTLSVLNAKTVGGEIENRLEGIQVN